MASPYTIVCRSVVTGDELYFSEEVRDRRKRWKVLGHRQIKAKVVRESYGEETQQHTFSLLIQECEGYEPIKSGMVILRKGRVLYSGLIRRKPWKNEHQRQLVADEKHARGAVARKKIARRRKGELPPAWMPKPTPIEQLRSILRRARK